MKRLILGAIVWVSLSSNSMAQSQSPHDDLKDYIRGLIIRKYETKADEIIYDYEIGPFNIC